MQSEGSTSPPEVPAFIQPPDLLRIPEEKALARLADIREKRLKASRIFEESERKKREIKHQADLAKVNTALAKLEKALEKLDAAEAKVNERLKDLRLRMIEAGYD